MADAATIFRFRPRYRGLAWSSVGVGGTLAAISLALLGAALLPLATGAVGVALGCGYMLSPSWKMVVVVDDDGLEVRSPKGTKFRVAWSDIARVVSSPSTSTCFVDGGAPEKSLLVPGDGAPAPYDLENRPALCAAILAHVPAERVETVSSLDAKK
ncbi:MAG TPA: hypothetical protein VGG74_24890 [Kofleriaceae bacterium]